LRCGSVAIAVTWWMPPTPPASASRGSVAGVSIVGSIVPSCRWPGLILGVECGNNIRDNKYSCRTRF
jgi:hypothetical protein